MRPKHLENPKPIPVQLDKALRDRIETMAERLGEGKSTIMRMAMRIGLEALEKTFETGPADLLALVSKLESPKNLSGSASPGHRDGTSGAMEGLEQKRNRAS